MEKLLQGFHDHLVTHAVVKRVFLELKTAGEDYLKRLAFITLIDNGEPVWGEGGKIRLKMSDEELVDCVLYLAADDIEMLKKSLSCYTTYKDTIEKSGVVEKIGDKLYFEFFGEDFVEPVNDITAKLS